MRLSIFITFILLVCLTGKKGMSAVNRTASFFHSDTAYIVGSIKNYTGSYGEIHFQNVLTDIFAYAVVVEISPEGNFCVPLPLCYPIRNNIIIKDKSLPFYITPGDTLYIETEWTDEKNHPLLLHYKGKLASLNEELFQARSLTLQSTPYLEASNNDSVRLAYASQLTNAYHDYLSRLQQYARQHRISDKTRQLLANEALLSQAVDLLEFDRASYDLDSKILPHDPAKDSFYQLLKEIPWDDRTLLSNRYFPEFIGLFDYSILLHKKWRLLNNNQFFFLVLEKAGYQLTGKEKELKDYFKNTPSSSDSLKMKELQTLKDKYYILPIVGVMENLIVRNRLFYEDMHIPHGIVWEVSDLRKLLVGSIFINDRKEALQKRDLIMKNLKDPFLIATAIKYTDELFPETTHTTSYILPLGKATEIFERITAPYKGQVILIDVWATWCTPCLQGIKNLEPIRKKYADRNVAFVFVSAEKNSPLPNFERVMKNVEGYKFRLNDEEYLHLCQAFKIQGIPHYILVDAFGEVVDPNFHYKNLEHLESVLDKLLE